jgi:putative salt-induced outer membrane protein YdiY
VRSVGTIVCALALCAASASEAHAQPPVPPPAVVQPTTAAAPQGLHGSAGFGLSLTQGNSDTLNISATVDSTYDPKEKNAMRWNALFLRGKQNGVLSVNRFSAMYRDEYTVNGRVFMFAQLDVLHDTFKGIDYLVAPATGVGYKVIDIKPTTFNVDAGIGGVVERDTGLPALGSGSLTFSEKLVHQLSDTTTLKETAATLLKTDDLANYLYTFQVGVAARVNSRLQLSIDLLDTFKNQPVDGLTHKHDVALVTSVVAKY